MADDDKSSRILDLRKSLREETTKREKIESEKSLLEKQFKEKEKKLKQLKTEKSALEDQFRESSKVSEQLDKDKKELEAKQIKKKSKIKALKDENQSLTKQIRLGEKNLKAAEEDKRAMERKMKRRSSALAAELETLESEAQQLKDLHTKKLEELTTDNRSLSDKITRKRPEVTARSSPDNTEERISALEADKKDLERKNKDLTRRIEELESENTTLKNSAKQATERSNQKVEKLESKIVSLNDKIKQLQDKTEQLQLKAQDDAKKLLEEKLLDTPDEEPKSLQRQSSTVDSPFSSVVAKDEGIDEYLAKYPNAEKAKIWEYIPNSERWDDGKWSVQLAVISMEKRPFAEGSLRTAYKTKHLQNDGVYVTKMSKNRAHGREIYENDVEMQVFCRRWAERYNEENPPKKVTFVNAYLVELIDRPRSPVATLELFIEGEYRKYSNNDGQTRYDRNTPQAFSHFTYERSNHETIIVDIQGVDDNYTDPQVHSKDHKGFGIGNLGQKGIVKFVITHQCNAICKYLKLPPIQEKYGKIAEIKMDKGTMAFPFDLVKALDTSGGPQILQDATEPKVDLSSFRCVETLKGEEKVLALCMNYKYLFVGSSSAVNVYKLNGCELHGSLKGHTDQVEALCVNDEYLFSGGADKDIRVWDVENMKCVKIITDHTSNVKALVADAGHLYSGSHDKTVRVWSLKDFSCEAVLHGHEKFVKALALSGDSRALFSGGNDNVIKVWDLQTHECVYNLDSHTKWLKTLFVSGQYLFSGANDKRIKIWNLKTLDLATTLKPHTDKINTVLANQAFFVSGSDDSTMKIYDYKTLQCVTTLNDHKGSVVTMAMNEEFLCSASFDGIKIWTWTKK